MLVGPAGTGKGVVIDAAARAEQHRRPTRRSGSPYPAPPPSGSAPTAQRSPDDTHPRLAGRARQARGPSTSDRDTTVFLDEAGMVDHQRLDALTELVERSGAKLIAVGDGKQLPSIGPGGMFDRLSEPHPHRRAARHPPHPGPRRAARMASAARRRTRARDGALRPPRTSCTSTTPATKPARPPSNAGHTLTQRARHPRGRVDRRRVQPGDRPAQRPRATPPRTTRRTRTPPRSRSPTSTTACAKAT